MGLLIAVIVAFMLAMAAYDVPILVRKESWQELAAFSVLWLVGLVFGILQLIGYPLPNPTLWILESMPEVTRAAGALLGLD